MTRGWIIVTTGKHGGEVDAALIDEESELEEWLEENADEEALGVYRPGSNDAAPPAELFRLITKLRAGQSVELEHAGGGSFYAKRVD